MKLASYLYGGTAGWGVIMEDGIAPMKRHWPLLSDALAAGHAVIAERLSRTGERIDPKLVEWLPPVPQPGKILCVGINYGRHVLEAGRELPQYPSVFVRFADSFVAHGQPIVRPQASERFDYEAELAVVIGREGRHIKAADALHYIGGYTCLAENSVRDYQKHNAQVTPGKNFDRSGSIGPWIVTADEIADPQQLQVIGRLNGEQMQHGHTSDMLFPVAQMIAYISTFTTLRPGDIIATGTPEGVGSARKPPVWMKAGDVLEIEIPGIGVLRNPVIDEIIN